MMDVIDKLKKISLRNRQRIIEVVGLDFELQQVMILKYCKQMSRYEIADTLCVSVDSVDRYLTKARNMFNNILATEYHLFTEDQKEVLNLLVQQKDKIIDEIKEEEQNDY